MAVPKRRKSKSKTRMGRANKGMTAPKWVKCPQCSAAVLPHRVCPTCGHYQGRQVVDVEDK
jgi:large subunit ribosomal protein L32